MDKPLRSDELACATTSRGDAILKWFDTTQYSATPAFRFGNTPRVTELRGDGIKNVDFSLFKNNRFNDGKWNAQIRVEAFNVLNRTRFDSPNTQVDSAAFGTINGAGGGRQVQIGLKLLFDRVRSPTPLATCRAGSARPSARLAQRGDPGRRWR